MKKLLIAYDTGYGSTGEVAEIIKLSLIDSELQVDVTSVDTAIIDSYDCVLVGSPIRLGKFTTKVKRFLKKNKMELAQHHVGFFLTCMSVTKNPMMPEPLALLSPAILPSILLKI